MWSWLHCGLLTFLMSDDIAGFDKASFELMSAVASDAEPSSVRAVSVEVPLSQVGRMISKLAALI